MTHSTILKVTLDCPFFRLRNWARISKLPLTVFPLLSGGGGGGGDNIRDPPQHKAANLRLAPHLAPVASEWPVEGVAAVGVHQDERTKKLLSIHCGKRHAAGLPALDQKRSFIPIPAGAFRCHLELI